jgi:hypothetical protein
VNEAVAALIAAGFQAKRFEWSVNLKAAFLLPASCRRLFCNQ